MAVDEMFLRCRNYSHAWQEFYPEDLPAPFYGWRLSLRCLRCDTERHDNLDYHGGLIGRRYFYAPGYMNKGEEKPTKQVFREELFDRLREQLAEHRALGGIPPAPPEAPAPSKRVRKSA